MFDEGIDKEIDKEIESIDFGIELSKQGYYTSYLVKENKKKYIMSKYNPMETIQGVLDKIEYNRETTFIVIGYGFGYILEKLIGVIGEEVSCLIIEPNREFLYKQLECRPNNKYEEYKNIKIINGKKEELDTYLEDKVDFKSLYNMQFIIHHGYEEMYPCFIKNILLWIKEFRDTKIISQNTDKTLSKFFIKNIISNTSYIAKSNDIKQHKNKFKGVPAVIVSAGPSLDKNINLIQDFKGLIFTGGRSLSAILEQGIKPDFLVSIDASDISYDTLKKNKVNDIPLITVLQVNPQIVASNKGPKYFLNMPDISQEFLGIKLETLPVSGSVATLCLSTAYYMGCNPIIFIGQDMAFTGEKLHAGSCTIENEPDAINKYAGTRMIKEYYGGKVLSRSDYIGFLRWFEAFIKYYSDITYINATEGGAYIEGALHISFKEVINQYNPIQKVIIEHNQKPIFSEKEIKKCIKKELKKLKEDLVVVQEGYRLSKALLNEYEQYKGKNVNKIIKFNNQLQRVENNFINQEENKHFVGYLFDHMYKELIMYDEFKEKINESSFEKDMRIVKFNFEIYKRLVKAFKEMIQVIELNLF